MKILSAVIVLSFRRSLLCARETPPCRAPRPHEKWLASKWIQRRSVIIAIAVAGVIFPLSAGVASAQYATPDGKPPLPALKMQTEMEKALEAARPVVVRGPTEVPLLDQAVLHLPADYVYIPAKEARAIMAAMGNRLGDGLLGVLFPATRNEDWFIIAQYQMSGYISDDDAKDWNAEEMLESIKTSTEEANKERVSRGIAAMEVTGWVERPHYDPAAHQLKWSISSKDKDARVGARQGINYNTFTLGREGFVSLNLVTDLKVVEAQKPLVSELLSGLKFKDGKRYADFNSSTDKVAEYGLAALVAGVAAKKLGLLALASVFVAKFFKVIVIGGLVALWGGFKAFRRRTKSVPGQTAPVDLAARPGSALLDKGTNKPG